MLVDEKKKLLQDQQQRVGLAASMAAEQPALQREQNAMADRDAARSAYAEMLRNLLPYLLRGRTVDDLRSHATRLAADAAALASKLADAVQLATRSGFDPASTPSEPEVWIADRIPRSSSVTSGCVQQIFTDAKPPRPVVQLIDLKQTNTGDLTAAPRFK